MSPQICDLREFECSAGMENRLSMYPPDWVQHHGASSAKLTQRDWDFHRTAIQELYFIEKHPLKKVRTIMAERHGFHATERMYKARLRVWNVRKNCTAKEMVKVIKIINDRAGMGKETAVRVHGVEIDATKLRKFRNRMRKTDEDLLVTGSSQSSTPSDISCFTPRDSPEPELIRRNIEENQLSSQLAVQQDFNLDSIPYYTLNHTSINAQAFAEVSLSGLADPQTILSEEMFSITNTYYEAYFQKPVSILYSMQSVDFDGDEIRSLANLDSTNTIEANKEVFDFTNPGTLVTLYEVACLLFQRDNAHAANRLIEQAKELIGSLLQDEHPQLLGCLFLVVCTLEAKEREDLVTGLLDFAQWKSTSIHGPTHPISRIISCCSRASASRHSNASHALEGAVATFQRLLGLQNTLTLRVRQLHAWSLFQQGRLDAALVELQNLQRTYNTLAGDDHIHSRHTLFQTAQIYTAQGKLDEAEELFQRVYSLSEKKFGRDPPLMIKFECLRMLAGIYRRQERSDMETSTLCHALPMGMKVLGREHPTVLLLSDDLKKKLA